MSLSNQTNQPSALPAGVNSDTCEYNAKASAFIACTEGNCMMYRRNLDMLASLPSNLGQLSFGGAPTCETFARSASRWILMSEFKGWIIQWLFRAPLLVWILETWCYIPGIPKQRSEKWKKKILVAFSDNLQRIQGNSALHQTCFISLQIKQRSCVLLSQVGSEIRRLGAKRLCRLPKALSRSHSKPLPTWLPSDSMMRVELSDWDDIWTRHYHPSAISIHELITWAIHGTWCEMLAVNQDACGILGNLGRKGCGAGLWCGI